jgi:hypothetical protein
MGTLYKEHPKTKFHNPKESTGKPETWEPPKKSTTKMIMKTHEEAR